jgi:hypothetical protein
MDANFQRVPSINSFTLLMNGANFTTGSFLEGYLRSFAVSRVNFVGLSRFVSGLCDLVVHGSREEMAFKVTSPCGLIVLRGLR